MRTRLMTTVAGVGGMLVAFGAAAPASAGVSGPAFYVDGTLYRTVGTPALLPSGRAAERSWDVIYDFGGAQMNVATAAPGDRDYSGGRWQVHGLEFPDGYAAALADADMNSNDVIDSDAELGYALAAGTAVDTGVAVQFECPVIPLPRGRA